MRPPSPLQALDQAPGAPSDTVDKDGYHDGRCGTDTCAQDAAGDDAESAIEQIVREGGAIALADLVERTRRTLDEAIPVNTRLAYQSDLRHFAAWCTRRGLVAMPAPLQTIVLYMRDIADHGRCETGHGLKVSSIERALAALSTAHARAGHPSPWAHPLVKDMRHALRKEKGVRLDKKKGADDAILRQLVGVLGDSRLGVRDRSLLTMGWMGACRRSTLVGINVEDIERAPKGLKILVRKSKTDQEGRGHEIPIFFSNDVATCPVRSLDAWLAASGIIDGAIFRALGRDDRLGRRLAPAAVADRIKHYAKLAGLEWKDFAGHSLRRGFVTTAIRRGRDADSIMVTTGQRSYATLREYIERETIFERAAGEGLL